MKPLKFWDEFERCRRAKGLLFCFLMLTLGLVFYIYSAIRSIDEEIRSHLHS